jgi:hypothetical protein
MVLTTLIARDVMLYADPLTLVFLATMLVSLLDRVMNTKMYAANQEVRTLILKTKSGYCCDHSVPVYADRIHHILFVLGKV